MKKLPGSLIIVVHKKPKEILRREDAKNFARSTILREEAKN